MKQDYLNFSRNYNLKFSTEYFTTMRSPDTVLATQLRVGDILRVQMMHKTIFKVEVVGMACIDIDNLTDSEKVILVTDTGMPWQEAVKELRQVCGGNIVVVITLRRIQKT